MASPAGDGGLSYLEFTATSDLSPALGLSCQGFLDSCLLDWWFQHWPACTPSNLPSTSCWAGWRQPRAYAGTDPGP